MASYVHSLRFNALVHLFWIPTALGTNERFVDVHCVVWRRLSLFSIQWVWHGATWSIQGFSGYHVTRVLAADLGQK